MFSRHDLGSGSLHPLFWVLAPLVLGALLVTGLGILARSTQGFPNVELAEDLRVASRGGDPLLAEVTDFHWDRVCVFPQSASKEQVDAALGFRWGVIGGDPSGDGRSLLVFVRGGEVATHLFLEPGLVDAPVGDGDCRRPDDESTRLGGADPSSTPSDPTAEEALQRYACARGHASFTVDDILTAAPADAREDPRAAVLGMITESPRWPEMDRWRRVVETPDEIVFLAETPEDEAPFAVVHVVPGGMATGLVGGWGADSYGACTPRRLVPDALTVADWWVDGSAEPIGPDSQSISVLVHELACASGQSAEGRILRPTITYGPDEVIVMITVRTRAGDQACQGNPATPFTIQLDERLGNRTLLDGGRYPPRDATAPLAP